MFLIDGGLDAGDEVAMTTKQRLEKMLNEKGYLVDALYGVKGQWRKTIMDVQRWHAYCRKPGSDLVITVGSWETMTDCVRRGFTLAADPIDGPTFLDVRVPPKKEVSRASAKSSCRG